MRGTVAPWTTGRVYKGVQGRRALDGLGIGVPTRFSSKPGVSDVFEILLQAAILTSDILGRSAARSHRFVQHL